MGLHLMDKKLPEREVEAPREYDWVESSEAQDETKEGNGSQA